MIILLALVIASLLTILPNVGKNKDKNKDVKIPILLYHDFVPVVPDNV